MRPKKKDKVVHNEAKPQFEQIQADHELFLQAFESKLLPKMKTKVAPDLIQNGSMYSLKLLTCQMCR